MPLNRRTDERGVTLIELMVVLTLLTLVLVSFYGALNSLMTNTGRQQALVTNQESVRFALLDMTRDIRAANPLSTLSSPTAYPNQLEATVLPATGSTPLYVRWQLSGTTLTRSLLNAPGGTVMSTKTVLTNVQNAGTGTSLFRYFNSSNAELLPATNAAGDFSNCTVRVHISVSAAVGTGPAPFTVESDAEVRNRLPGGIGC
jgi:prepilin-type N-terminal cleavage/methylation domain-containing protein